MIPGVGIAKIKEIGRKKLDRTWSASNSCAARQVPRGKEIIWMNNVRTLARVMSAARDKNYNVYAARGGKNVAHHCHTPSFGILEIRLARITEIRLGMRKLITFL